MTVSELFVVEAPEEMLVNVSPDENLYVSTSSELWRIDTEDQQYNLELSSDEFTLEVGNQSEDLYTQQASELLVVNVGPPGVSVATEFNEALVSLQWGTPASESSNAIEITGETKTFDGNDLLSDVVDVTVVVSDGATDAEPSATATLSAANSPVGTVMSGSGTATMTIRSDNGQLAVRVTETSAAHRYLWVRAGGHSRLWVRSLTGVQELIFT